MSNEKVILNSLLALVIVTVCFLVRLLLIPIFALVMGLPFFFLWNFAMPPFGLPTLSYLQGVCLLIVASWLLPTSYVPIKIKE